MLCFEVWRNDAKIATAGLSHSGVLTFMLTWVGHDQDASAVAGSTLGVIRGLSFRLGGIDGSPDPLGDKSVEWFASEDLKLGDELRVRLISSDTSDPPQRSSHFPRGKTNWIEKSK